MRMDRFPSAGIVVVHDRSIASELTWQSPASDYYRGDDQKRRDERPKSGLQQAGNRHPQNGPERVECLQPADALAPLAFWCELDDEQACYGVRPVFYS